jgi:predicted transcriptional regulator
MYTTAAIPTTTAGPGTSACVEVLSGVTAGGWSLNHAEGVVVESGVTAGGWQLNHAEGVVVESGVVADGPGIVFQHAEGVVR